MEYETKITLETNRCDDTYKTIVSHESNDCEFYDVLRDFLGVMQGAGFCIPEDVKELLD